MISKSIIVASMLATPLVLSGNCPNGAFTLEFTNGHQDTFPLDPKRCHHAGGSSHTTEFVDDVLKIYEYTDNNCENRTDSATQTVAIDETHADEGWKLIDVTDKNACNCDYIEIYQWYVPKDENCGFAKDHMDEVVSMLHLRSQLFACINESDNYNQESVVTEIYGCNPDKDGMIGKVSMYNNSECLGGAQDSWDIAIANGTMKGIVQDTSSGFAVCREVKHCDDGMNHAGTEFYGLPFKSDQVKCSNASQISIQTVMMIMFAIITFF